MRATDNMQQQRPTRHAAMRNALAVNIISAAS